MSEENTEGQTTEAPQATENSGSDAAPKPTYEELEAALAAERGKKEKAVQESKTLRDRAKAAETSKSDEVKSVEQKTAETLTKLQERIAKSTQRAVRSEVKALAADLLQDPTDAHALLDLSKYADDDGEIDSDAIKTDLAELVERKPHLAKAKAPKQNPAQGSSAKGSEISIDSLIAEANKQGDWRKVMRLQNQKLLDKNE